jgi:hypothetical protein
VFCLLVHGAKKKIFEQKDRISFEMALGVRQKAQGKAPCSLLPEPFALMQRQRVNGL